MDTHLPHHWYQSIRKVFSLFTAKEVKTPLSFFYRISTVIVLLVSFGVFVVQPSERLRLFEGAAILLFLLAIIVGFIAFVNPKNLVFGESGYRAESKLSLGTEQEQISLNELTALSRSSNPSVPSIVVGEKRGPVKLLLVTFSLRNTGRDYDSFFVALRGNALQWWHFIEQTAVVATYYDANTFALKLSPHLEPSDSLLVVEIQPHQMQGWLPKPAWDWLNGVSEVIAPRLLKLPPPYLTPPPKR